MPDILKNTLAVVAGLIIGSIVNMTIVMVGPMLIPLPDGVDMTNMDKFAENLKLLKPQHFVSPWVAHALGTLIGALVAAKLAASHKMIFALVIGAFFLMGGTMMAMMGGPIWFTLLDLIGAYLPMGYLGGILGGANNRNVSRSDSGEHVTMA